MKTALTIAGSDSSGGAGIQADLKTMCAHKVYGMSVITALTAQNTLGVQGIHTPPAAFIRTQIDSVFNDIRPDAVKIGMLSNADAINTVAEALSFYKPAVIILDPVMVSTSHHRLLEQEAEEALIAKLLPLATIITPNLPEAAVLAKLPTPTNRDEMLAAAKKLTTLTNAAILVKGGHLEDDCSDDLLLYEGEQRWYETKRINTSNTHGTGCTLSSAIACNMAFGYEIPIAVKKAKDYITGALQNDPKLGHGNGPLNHIYNF
ncbi:MAG: bifunctional hydroxymethylpyrimidine kinase/phosphomethylpyrimidine kinase [Lentisphaerae bacterium]|jgi:hydroxymethylpyrimidine/phosphomethylpyrimidine kinase|nr:bifunctional hydroxymethylpyrimidine kinase/phosphomethylpyrimidine kinase [Lentisphaerota bacterium]